jgi:hypothetical protein
MGKITEGIRAAADTLGSARAIHEHASYFANHIPKQSTERKEVSLKAHGPKQTVVNEDTLFTGEAAMDVKITSDGEYVRTIRPVNGVWMTLLTFSKPGEYHVTFTSGSEKEVLNLTAYTDATKKQCGCGK